VFSALASLAYRRPKRIVVTAFLAALAAGALVAVQSAQGRTFWEFVQSSRIELRKVVWPDRQETVQVTIIVFVMIIVLGLFFWGLDSLLAFLTKWLAGRGG
jgi:preprotein translocase subunit SecE